MADMKCFFCMERVPVELYPDKLDNGGIQDFWLCERCFEEKKAADKRRDNVMEYLSQDPSDLCTKCGVCCFMLHAKVTKQEVDKMVEVHGIKPSTFAILPPFIVDPEADHMMIKMPCRFLLGRPLVWSACQIHEKYRPEVCGSYLCKMAIRYRLGTISLHEARYWLRVAIQTKDFSIFNWVRSGDEIKVLMASAIGNRVEALRKEGLSEEQIKIAVAQLVTPHYRVSSDADHFTLNMHFSTHDRGDTDLRIFMKDDEIDDVSVMRPLDAARYGAFKAMSALRALFTRTRRDGIEQVIQIDEEQADELKDNLEKEVRLGDELNIEGATAATLRCSAGESNLQPDAVKLVAFPLTTCWDCGDEWEGLCNEGAAVVICGHCGAANVPGGYKLNPAELKSEEE